MILINCPYCGEREQSEFTNGGEAHVIRPKDPDALSDKEWGQYVFYRSNPKGIFYGESYGALQQWSGDYGDTLWPSCASLDGSRHHFEGTGRALYAGM